MILSDDVVRDLIDKAPGTSADVVRRRSGVRRRDLEARCQELYGQSFAECRAQRQQADQATLGRGTFHGIYIRAGRARGACADNGDANRVHG